MSWTTGLLLLSTPLLPLLLVLAVADPRLACCRPWLGYLALLPALLLALLPEAASVALPWVLFGSGLAIDGTSRWWLAMSVLLWAVAAARLRVGAGAPPDDKRLMVFLLLTMAGNLGLILTTELAGWLACSALMGYGFYGLLVENGDPVARRAGRLYLGLLIVADLLLFDALLIAVGLGVGLGFAELRQALPGSPSAGLYLAMVLLGFGLKAAVWPLHFWLSPAFASSRPAVTLLIAGVPIAGALFGLLRWLPLGEAEFSVSGLMVQGIGVAALLHVTVRVVKRGRPRQLPVDVLMVGTGLFAIGVGTGLGNPSMWNRYPLAASAFVMVLGGGVAMLSMLAGRQSPVADRALWFERAYRALRRWGGARVLPWLQSMCSPWHAGLERLGRASSWRGLLDGIEAPLQRWSVVIGLFVLLALLIMIAVAVSGAVPPA